MAGSQSASSPAQAAFDKALGLIRADQPSAIPSSYIDRIHTIDDVRDEVQNARRKYENKPKSEVRKWLGQFSQGVMHYAQVFDVLVSHHPEYVSLAWGTTKFLFVVRAQKIKLMSSNCV
jgi:hypothetical protein